MVNIGVIGYGNMGSMIAGNILKLDLLLDDEKLFVSNHNLSKLDNLKEIYHSVTVTSDNKFLAENCEVIIICVKTPSFLNVLGEIKPFLKEDVHIVTSCAGVDFDEIGEVYTGGLSIVIPSLASYVTQVSNIASNTRRKGISLFYHNSDVSNLEKNFIEGLFDEFSFVKVIDNYDDLNIATILTSCSPAFLALLVSKLADIGVNNSSLSKDEIVYMIIKTMIGSGHVLDSEFEIEDVISRVATPGGITQEGLDFLEEEISEDGEELFEILLKKYE
jgi:pyrroline-5-carboxylate reductase